MNDIIDCILEKNEQGTFTCKNCGLTLPIENIRVNCKARRPVDNSPPSMLKKIVNFVSAAANHAVLGNPTVSPEILEKRLAICRGCELFKPNQSDAGGVCTHNSCGCNIKDNVQYLNKLAWADQECPLKKWLKEQTAK